MNDRLLLVCDLDGTLLGNSAALRRFADWLRQHRGFVALTYATGRTVHDIRSLVSAGEAPAPDFVIGSVGTELADFAAETHDAEWEDQPRDGWCADAVRRVADQFPELTPQPAIYQSARKVCYFSPGASADRLDEFQKALLAAGVRARVVYSGRRFVDVLAPGMDKGSALQFLVQTRAWNAESLIVCGDSGNDASMFCCGFRGVMVANADEDLRSSAEPPVYHSRREFADGVLDGVRHWSRELPIGRNLSFLE